MSKIALKKALLNVLRANQSTQDIAEEEIYVSNLLKRLMEQPTNHLRGFAEYLQQDCAVYPQGIAALTEAIIANPDLMSFLKVKAYTLWLQYQIYGGVGILQNIKGSQANKIKRRKVAEVFVDFKCQNSTFTDFLKRCCSIIDLGQEQLQDITSAILRNVPFNIKQMFKEQQFHQKPSKEIEQKFKELISVYNFLPQGSFQQELLAQAILIHSQKHKQGVVIVSKALPHLSHRNQIQRRKQNFLHRSQNQLQPESEQRLKKNIEFLNFITAQLRNQSDENIFSNLQKIESTIRFLAISKLDQKNEQKIEEFKYQFVQYLNRLKNSVLYTIEFKLVQINDDSLKKIRQQHSKIESYVKMGSIGEKVQQAVVNLKEQFTKKLKAPFNDYWTREIPFLKEKGHYKFIRYSIDKLEKFSIHALGVSDIVSADQYAKISESETDIIKGLSPFYEDMEKDIQNFIKLQFAHSVMPQELKDIVKTLLTISQKNKACEYLTQKLNFQVGDKLSNIESKLDEIKDKIANAYQQSQTNALELQLLLADCKEFCDIEDIYKSKGEPQNKFGFRELRRRCNNELMKSLMCDVQRCKVIIEGKKPTNIVFSELQNYYDKFVNLNTADGNRKRGIIVSQLKKVEQKTLSDLNQFHKIIENRSSNDITGQIDDFLEALNQALALERNLKKLYSLEADKAKIEIKKGSIHKIGIKIISFYESEYEIVTQLLKNLNLLNIKQKLKTFGELENMIYDVFNLDDDDLDINQQQKVGKVKKPYSEVEQMEQMTIPPKKKSTSGEERLVAFIKYNVAILREKIQSHPFINQGKINARNAKRLKILLDIFKRGVQLEIKAKYETDGPTFNIDENFHSFYSNSNQEKRQDLKANVDNYFSEQYDEYKQNYNGELDVSDYIKINIEQKIRLLPPELRIYHHRTFNQIKKTLIKEYNNLIINASKNIIQNPSNITTFFSLADKARINGQTDKHKKFTKRFVDVYSQVQTKETTLDQKITFVDKSFIDVYMRQQEYFTSDTLMFEQFKKKYLSWINNITRAGKIVIDQIYDMHSLKNQQEKLKNCKALINTVFRVSYFIFKLKDDIIMDHSKIRQQFVQMYQKNFNQLIELCKQFLQGKSAPKISPKEMFEPNKMRKQQSYSYDSYLAGAILDEIKLHLKSKENNWKGRLKLVQI